MFTENNTGNLRGLCNKQVNNKLHAVVKDIITIWLTLHRWLPLSPSAPVKGWFVTQLSVSHLMLADRDVTGNTA